MARADDEEPARSLSDYELPGDDFPLYSTSDGARTADVADFLTARRKGEYFTHASRSASP